MSVVSALYSGMSGMRAATERLDAAARGVARAPISDDLPEHLVGMITAQHAFTANAAVVKSADEMIGTLLDVLA